MEDPEAEEGGEDEPFKENARPVPVRVRSESLLSQAGGHSTVPSVVVLEPSPRLPVPLPPSPSRSHSLPQYPSTAFLPPNLNPTQQEVTTPPATTIPSPTFLPTTSSSSFSHVEADEIEEEDESFTTTLSTSTSMFEEGFNSMATLDVVERRTSSNFSSSTSLGRSESGSSGNLLPGFSFSVAAVPKKRASLGEGEEGEEEDDLHGDEKRVRLDSTRH